MPLHPQAEAIARAFAERVAAATGPAPTIEARRAMVDAAPRQPGPEMALVEDRTVEGPNGDVPVRVLVPHGEGPLPVVLYFHGGGWVIGTVDSSEATGPQHRRGERLHRGVGRVPAGPGAQVSDGAGGLLRRHPLGPRRRPLRSVETGRGWR